MNPKSLVPLAALALAALALPAEARERHGSRHAPHWAPRHAPHHHHHRHAHRGPRWAGPAYYWSAPYPRWWYAPAYPFAYSVPLYEPPVYVERVYEPVIVEREPVVVERAPRYEERSYAQAEPRAPRPVEPARPAPPTAPRLERYTLSATELFEFDKATLKRDQPRLDEIADALERHPQIERVRITGYTDRLGSEAYNLKLSQRRADAVKAYLVARGVAASRLRAEGRGEADPVVQCSQKDQAALIRCLEPNRRVEVEQITVQTTRRGER